jgi:hypothetical protein
MSGLRPESTGVFATIPGMVFTLASSFSDSLSAWATAAGAVGTVATLGFLVFELAIDRRARRVMGKRAQAEKVSGWIGSDWMHQTGNTKPRCTAARQWFRPAVRFK